MTEADLDRIECELKITLPTVYRQFMVPFPIPALAGNTDTGLTDHADQLIKDNRELHVELWEEDPWKHFFCLGVDGSGSCHALDLRGTDGPVHWVDHCSLDPEPSAGESFSKWSKRYVADLRFDLEATGYSPDWTPQELEQAQARDFRRGCKATIVFIVVTVAVVVGVYAVILFIWF